MQTRGVSHRQAECPVARTVDVIGDRWSLLIVRDVFDGIGRFRELQRNLGLAKNILATRLRELVAQGILETVPAGDGSAYQAYSLTRKGRDLFSVIVALRQWGETYLFDEGEPHSVLLDRESRLPLKLRITDASDRPISSDDAFVRKVSDIESCGDDADAPVA
ncbi:MAG TPA: helix-turn-helix domain-containing protein [Pseudonocardia sp.]|jgi:DNA-binding HxlR family transcriptional regulator|nr:helix-turn-helix domain-containing protein [Pseudonocardia sp.]